MKNLLRVSAAVGVLGAIAGAVGAAAVGCSSSSSESQSDAGKDATADVTQDATGDVTNGDGGDSSAAEAGDSGGSDASETGADALGGDGSSYAYFPMEVVQAVCNRVATCCEGSNTSAFNMAQCLNSFTAGGGFNGDGLYFAVSALETDGGARVTFNQASATACLNDIAAMGCGNDPDTAWQQTTADCFGALTGQIPVNGTFCHGSIECETGSYCELSTGTCKPILSLGAPCTTNDECEYRGTTSITAYCNYQYPTPDAGTETCVAATTVGNACGFTYYYEQECTTFVCNPSTALCDTSQLFSDPGTPGGLCATLTLTDAGGD
jgi:hypothetical protein